MTDPVPYEPAENIPPIPLWREMTAATFGAPTPFNAVRVEWDSATGEPVVPSIRFEAPLLDYNLDDRLDWRVFVDVSPTAPGFELDGTVQPTGTRERTVRFDLSTTTGDLADDEPKCHKVLLVVSDRGWGTGGAQYDVPVDSEGEPVTAPVFVQWLVWINKPAPAESPRFLDCAGATTFPQ